MFTVEVLFFFVILLDISKIKNTNSYSHEVIYFHEFADRSNIMALTSNLDFSNNQPVWYPDYIRSTDDSELIWKHFFKDFIFQHRLR